MDNIMKNFVTVFFVLLSVMWQSLKSKFLVLKFFFFLKHTYQGQFHKDQKGLWLTIDFKQPPPQPVPRGKNDVGWSAPRCYGLNLQAAWSVRQILSGWSSPLDVRTQLIKYREKERKYQMKYCRRNKVKSIVLKISPHIFPAWKINWVSLFQNLKPHWPIKWVGEFVSQDQALRLGGVGSVRSFRVTNNHETNSSTCWIQIRWRRGPIHRSLRKKWWVSFNGWGGWSERKISLYKQLLYSHLSLYAGSSQPNFFKVCL